MHMRRVELRDFRNYGRLGLDLAEGITVLCGPNGAGKSNLLEGICVAASGESPRTRATEEIVRLGCEHGFAGTRVGRGGEEVRLEVGLARNGRRQIKVNGVERRRADLIGVAPVVYFSAADIEVVKGEPAGRRRLLDTALCDLSRGYYFHLLRYRRAVAQRNRVLRELRSGRGEGSFLSPWDRAAARYGARVMVDRRALVGRLSAESGAAHARLVGETERFVMEYRPSVDFASGQREAAAEEEPTRLVEEVASALEEALRRDRTGDMERGATRLGPHRDDLELLLGGQPVRAFGSQGEQRSCGVAIRLGLATVAEEMTGERPLLALDDVLSELDARARAGVFQACAGAEQVLITCCDAGEIPEAARAEATVHEVEDGRVT